MNPIDELIKRLNRGPSVLFLGQSYLCHMDGTNPLINEIIRKYCPSYPPPATDMFDVMFCKETANDKEKEDMLGYCDQFTRRLSSPDWLEETFDFPWNHVYSSSIESVWFRRLSNSWRKVSPIYSLQIKPLDSRSQVLLNSTFLYGSIENPFEDSQNRPPMSEYEKLSRRGTLSSLLGRLPEIITPMGVLIIEGYDPEYEWLKVDDLNSQHCLYLY